MGLSVSGIFGRNLTLASEQDSDRYDAKQQSGSAGGSFTFGSMTGSASVSASRDRMHSTWQSVEEQTGLFAGRGGFDVSVGARRQDRTKSVTIWSARACCSRCWHRKR